MHAGSLSSTGLPATSHLQWPGMDQAKVGSGSSIQPPPPQVAGTQVLEPLLLSLSLYFSRKLEVKGRGAQTQALRCVVQASLLGV